ncbi:protein BREAST CANCER SUSCEPTIBILITY 2 homolog A-like isoform X2 [Hordeum vulgare subsp. vulgare]|uniref:protein BREAST CANCER SUSCEPTIBILITY 2 homolog A-like isoform X2 n=1 Tax=Hordeum vulgare subsp. vulgare TaxID=112509 RepID=UPI001D1A4053|nr:protein BREAST CANCER SUSCEPTIBILITY 2 homolog A-like isoform X2 [Hordeum vulgare subsp. vulgare]
MPGRWRVWGQPDGSLVWIPAPELGAPLPPAAAPPPPPPLPPGRGAGIADASSEDALSKGRGAADGCRVESMADLLVQARNTLLEGDRMSGATVDAGEGQLFCTGSGRSVSVSERAIRRARALVGEDVEKAGTKRKQPFDDVPGAEGELRETDALFRGGVHNTTMPPVFQTGSGKTVLLGKDSIQKARAILGEQPFDDVPDAEGESSEMDAPFRGGAYNATRPPVFQTGSGKAVLLGKDSIQKARVLLEDVDRAAGVVEPMFRTGMGRPVPVSRTSIDKARAALEGQTVAEKGVDGMEQFPLFQTGSGRVVSVSAASVQKAKSVLKDNSTSEESFGRSNQAMMFPTGSGRPAMISERSIERSRVVGNKGDAKKSGHWDADCQFPMFQTGLGKPVAVSWSSVQKARAVLEEEKIKTTGRGDSSDCATTLQTETPTSVMSSSLIMNDRSVTPKEDSAMQVTRIEKNHKDDDHVPLFQTGLGRSIAISKSSLKRASAVLEPRNIAKELEDEVHLDGAHDTPVSRTGLGRSILASENSRKELPILEAEEAVRSVNNYNGETFVEEATFQAGIQKFVPQNRSSSHKASMLLEQRNFMEKGYEDCGSQLPMFRTGSGKSVLISENSVQKARAVLEEQGKISRDNPKLLNMDKKIPVFASPLKTSCARTVNISSVGVSRAATLLGLEENTLSTQFFGHVGDKLGRKINFERENPEQRPGLAPYPTENQVHKEPHRPFELSNKTASDSGEHSIRFSTAGGRSMAISSDALQRAKNLLGESDLVVSTNNLVGYSLASACNDKMENSTAAPKEGGPDLSKRRRASGRTELATFSHQAMSDRKHTGSFGNAAPTNESTNMFHVGSRSISEIPKITELSSRCLSEIDNANDTKDKTQELHMPAGALVDISNFMGAHSGKIDHAVNEKRRIGGRNSASSFKRPRSSRFITPISINKQSSAGVPKLPPTQITSCRTKLSSSYPFKHKRKTWKEYFGGPPCFNCLTEHITDEVKLMDAKGAEKYKFHDTNTGAEEFQKMLLACGASLTYATKEWVNNHYKWIVWKLASLERCYPTKAVGKFLTVPNVLDELKYRYDREVNNGHRSAIKKILEGNALPSLMMVLCISAIYSHPDVNKLEAGGPDGNENSIDNKSLLAAKRNMSAHIELTDGWYALEASLDVALSEQLQKRKLSMGQKLRIWGASLCGWTGPVSFHEASGTVKLTIHVNGSYRARWDDPLGFCKHIGPPLAFKCIKASGGRVPRTLVGVARIYPVLYRERLPEGRSVVRSERMERKALQLYQQRVSKIAEDIMSEQDENCANTDDSEEGAKICKMLEQAAEPEVMMAGMTSEQILSFSSYQAKQKEARQNEVAKKVENALEVAGLSSRDVTPFLKVRVTSLVHRISATKTINKEGLITIWNPTEKQKADLVEGQVYIATGLLPSAHCTNILYLHARGSSTTWNSLTSAQAADFEPFFTPRKAVELSWIGEVPLTSEFDIAGVVLHVGDVYSCSSQKRQWLFLTDGSKFISASQSTEQDDYLLAVSFSCSTVGDDSAFFSYALSGNTVGFSNLVKRHKDQTRRIWVAEATASSTYTLSHEISKKSHLKEAATRAEKWASSSFDKIQQLKERVLCIIGDSGG